MSVKGLCGVGIQITIIAIVFWSMLQTFLPNFIICREIRMGIDRNLIKGAKSLNSMHILRRLRYKLSYWLFVLSMMTSSNGNIFRVTGHLCGEFPGEFPTQRPVTRSFNVYFDLRINGWVNNREAGDLRRHHAHYDVIVMKCRIWSTV